MEGSITITKRDRSENEEYVKVEVRDMSQKDVATCLMHAIDMLERRIPHLSTVLIAALLERAMDKKEEREQNEIPKPNGSLS